MLLYSFAKNNKTFYALGSLHTAKYSILPELIQSFISGCDEFIEEHSSMTIDMMKNL